MKILKVNEIIEISGGCDKCIRGPLWGMTGFALTSLITAGLIEYFSPDTTELETSIVSVGVGVFAGFMAYTVGNSFFDKIDFHYPELID